MAYSINSTRNCMKHLSKNPIQKFLINNFYDSLLELFNETKAKSILDAGCGEGFTLQKIADNINITQTKLEGIDYSNDAISLGKIIHPTLRLRKADIYQLPYKNNIFDLVLCNEVLEHLESPRKALMEIMRVTKKYCLISVPNEPFFMFSNLIRGKNMTRLGNDIEHVNHWTVNSFAKFLEESGAKIVSSKVPFPWIVNLCINE